jgi:tRNA(Ile)-lysidine synthase
MENKYIIAVSGGPDSMCLLDIYKENVALVCHVNYNKRPTAKRDENIVKQYCKMNKIPLKVLNVTKKMYNEYASTNFQNKARLIRYNFFLECGKKIKNTNLLVAHQLDDFVETAYMQKQRKSKSLFYGIKKENDILGLNITRPLLNKRKS